MPGATKRYRTILVHHFLTASRSPGSDDIFGIRKISWRRMEERMAERLITDIGGLPGFHAAEAFGINNAGQIVGLSDGQGGIHAAYWHDRKVDDLDHKVVGLSVEFRNFPTMVGEAVRDAMSRRGKRKPRS